MYTFIVYIPNPPLIITRHFTFLEVSEAQAFANWLTGNGLSFDRKDVAPDVLTLAAAAVQKELDLAAQGRVD